MQVVGTILTVFLFVLSVLLILVVSAQTPKNEGFGGGVVNTPGGNFRGKAGYDEVLSNYTRTIAIAWIATALLVGVVSR